MLDMDLALELMKKYGYSSTNSHPYLYQSGDSVGICYTYVDEDFGTIERVKIFDTLEAFEEFLKQMDWLKKNGLFYHVRMCLDSYESINPKTLFLRNEKLMVEGEMDDINSFDELERKRDQMDYPTKLLYEAGDLLLIYDELKKRQEQYLLKIISLKNQLKQKYFDLQKSVDEYNKVKVEREIVKIPEVADSGGIDLQMEIALKDRYNIYIKDLPPVEEVSAFLKEVWDLNKNLELNARFYEALREETEVRNELKIVEKKQELMDNLNENLKPLFGVDLVGKFRKINKTMGATINSVSDTIVTEKIAQVEEKYKYYANIDPLYVSDYLREAIQNSNYQDLSSKYAVGVTEEVAKKSRTPLNEVASNLLLQYKNSLSVDEQAILVIYNNPNFRKICDAILSIPKFNTFTPKQIIKKLNAIKGFSKLKSICYISVRDRINDPLNQSIKASLFNSYDFTSFETFISSLMANLLKLKQINNKMILNGDINMYLPIRKADELKTKECVLVTNDIKTLSLEAKENGNMIGITLLKQNLPILYSPYYLDLGDIYDKNASPKIEIREMINFELLVDIADVVINEDKAKVNVINYYSEISTEGNVSVVRDIKSSGKTVFVKYAFLPKEVPVGSQSYVQQPAPVVAEMSVSAPVVELAPVANTNEQPVTEPVTVPSTEPAFLNQVAEETTAPQVEQVTTDTLDNTQESLELEQTTATESDNNQTAINASMTLPENEEDKLDKLLDTMTNGLPKDLSKNLEDTNEMELFADIADKKVPESVDVQKTTEPPKTQIVKKVITKPDGTKKVVMVRRVIKGSGVDSSISTGAKESNAPVVPSVKEMKEVPTIPVTTPPSTPVPTTSSTVQIPEGSEVKKVLRKVVGPNGEVKKVVVKKIVKKVDNK